MHLNWTSVWKVMTIWISREYLLFNFERLDVLCAWIGLPCDMLWPYEFLESIRCSISSVSMYYAPLSDFHVTIYDHLSLSIVMTIWISREHLWFNFKLLDILCASIGPSCDKLWQFEFWRASVFQFQASRYIMRLNRTSVWKVRTIWISREHLLFNFERLDVLCAWIGLPCDTLWPYEFLESFRCSISSI